ncbi:MAG: hypothetical protein CMR00_02750 [[Chlorobium] sp. 445]|nr:MAG: hypothetical protein CMR00_02750 [[Chlorobium] sp. 445]
MPKFTALTFLLYISLHVATGFYIYRKFARLLERYAIKDLKRRQRLAAIVIALLMSLPTLGFILNRFEVLRDSLLNQTVFFIGSAWILWLLIAFAIFIPADGIAALFKGVAWLVNRWLKPWYKRVFLPTREPTPVITALPDAPTSERSKESNESFQRSRREFLKKVAPLTLGFAAPSVITGYSIINNRTDFIVNQMTLRFPNLPSALRGLKIAQVSDIHSGPYMTQRQMEEIAEAVNAFHPDLVALTGDFIASQKEEIEPFVKGFRGLKSTFGTFACAGNHDEWVGIDFFTEAMAAHKEILLRNETRVLTISGEKLNVIGIDFARSNPALLEHALKSANPEGFNLLLCHYPDYFTTAKAAGIDLMLAGHTHGGQISLDAAGLEFYPIDLFYKYPRGLYEEGKEGGQKLYVNLGVGFSATPIRTVSPEIAVITLA